MRCGIVGAGKMGKEIAGVARARRHQVVWSLTSHENPGGKGLLPERLVQADVVFEFTSPGAATGNLLALAAAGSRVVCGTTGWTQDLPRVAEAFWSGGGALVHATNFSIGVRHFLEVARVASGLFSHAGYASFLVEEHHAAKRDAPSGTARTLLALIDKETGESPPVSSVRAGTVPGLHRLVFESPEDEVELIHRARGRAGFAKGAVWAAEWIEARRGVFEFGDLLSLNLRETGGQERS